MPSPCRNCGYEHDQCSGQVCPKCGHSNRLQPKVKIKKERHWCKICKKWHSTIKSITTEDGKPIEVYCF